MAALFASLLALANRSIVTVSFDPIPPTSEAWSVEAPLFLVILAAMFIGILMGGFVVWLERRKLPSPGVAPIIAASPKEINSSVNNGVGSV